MQLTGASRAPNFLLENVAVALTEGPRALERSIVTEPGPCGLIGWVCPPAITLPVPSSPSHVVQITPVVPDGQVSVIDELVHATE